MNTEDISFIIPVYNRPEETEELLLSFIALEGNKDFEIVIVEDGSTLKSDDIVKTFIKHKVSPELPIRDVPSRQAKFRDGCLSAWIILDRRFGIFWKVRPRP